MEKRNVHAQKTSSAAMAFYHEKGFVPAYQQAQRFAGESGRIATLPDLINARLATKPGDTPWETYFTTMSAEYAGLSRRGNKIIIVAHGVGPMATLEGVLAAYKYEFDDKTRDHRGGRISTQEFWDLESGKYGEVHIVDLKSYMRRYPYSFIQQLRSRDALTDPLLRARFGPRIEEYVLYHAQHAREWHLQQAGIDPDNRYELPNHDQFCDRRLAMHTRMAQANSNPFIVTVGDASNCPYLIVDKYADRLDGLALAHLLSVGQLSNLHHVEELGGGRRESYESLAFEASCHEWWNGVRLIGVRGNEPITGINPGAESLHKLIAANWRDLMRPTKRATANGFYALMNFAGELFTQYPKQGERMDTHEPEFHVTKATLIEQGPKQFRTTVGGYHGFFKYGINEVRQIAPPEANAYKLPGEVEIECQDGNPTHHLTPVEFYRVEIDPTKRLLRADQLRADYDLMMSLLA